MDIKHPIDKNFGRSSKFSKHQGMEQGATTLDLHKLDMSNENKYVLMLESTLWGKEARHPLDITDARFQTGPEFAKSNLPKLGMPGGKRFNFKFSDDQLKEMISTPKVIFGTTEYQMRYDSDRHPKNNMVHMYLLAPWLKDKDLPMIYRMDVVVGADNPNYHGFLLSAIVGGFKDGECQLFATRPGEGQEPATYYLTRSGLTNHQITERSPHQIEGEPRDVLQMADFAFSYCGVKYYQKYPTTRNKVHELAQVFSAGKGLNMPSELLAPTTGSQFMANTFFDREIGDNWRNFREIVSVASTSNTSMIPTQWGSGEDGSEGGSGPSLGGGSQERY